MLKVLLQILITLFLLICIFSFLLNYLNAWVNVSSSLPIGIYLIEHDKTAPAKGDLVLSCLPSHYANIAFERGYLTSGKCENKIAPVGKYIAAIEGDRVLTTSEGIYINKTLIPKSKAQTTDANRRKMFTQNINRTLRKNEIFLLNEKENSFDGRYFGIISTTYIVGKLKPLAVIEK